VQRQQQNAHGIQQHRNDADPRHITRRNRTVILI
jgi:hypothetical protein